ncbi:unnamed protein product [Rotaria sp. Silwood1]|nr:unnamed protein product [Rotaria sp. Silwood1]CAF3688512.1 unnamed protein product [Rotaria sp. Silwood1]CAF3749633.1 unnamed protein product [Rotaria sp. Silwood1]CAF4624872.1 unnamed protein product [Rotaria sp. Silwood1]CAF4736593.1 unnamed protein product [Rotaria sp. Silwood1]
MSDTEFLHKAIDNAKNFENFSDVLMAVSLHPEWLTMIPEDRRWAILHQIILSGNVNNLDQLLALQKSNKKFRLLTNTRDNQTILNIASLRNDIPDMIKRLQQLIKLDEMLNYAKDCEWDKCYDIAKENPNFINEKPPYRRYYLIHHMACANAIEQFERFKQIKNCIFNLNLRADRKKINEIAREEHQSKFAEYIEKHYPSLLDKDDSIYDELYTPTEEAKKRTHMINTMMDQRCIVKDLDKDLMGEPIKLKSRTEVMLHINEIRTQQENELKEKSKQASKVEEDGRTEMMIDTLTCPLTLAIFVDPVVAADGFTYERSAITTWLKNNDRSPMTNQKLPNKDLSSNTVVKQIINALHLTA